MAGDIVNLDAISAATVTVKKTIDGVERCWELRDTISTGILMWGMALSQMAARLEAAAASEDAAEIRAVQRELEERSLYMCAEIFRATYPQMADDEIERLFTHDERLLITRRFMNHRSSESSAPPSGGDRPPTSGSESATKQSTGQPQTQPSGSRTRPRRRRGNDRPR